jgi:cation:H+ antiporter
MLVQFLFLTAGLSFVALGAEAAVRGASSLALRLGVKPLVVGLTVVAFGTGSPELVVSVGSALKGSGGLAVGSVIGSNIANIALILGVSAVLSPLTVRAEVLRREVPLMIGVTGFFMLLLIDGEITRTDGLMLTAAGVGYMVRTYFSASRGPAESGEVKKEFAEVLGGRIGPKTMSISLIVAGIGSLVGGAHLLVEGAVGIARTFGISELVIGISVIAVGTSIPELATCAVAAVRGEHDIAFGNAVGSNVVNLLLVIGLAAMIVPLGGGDVRTVDLVALLGTALLLFVMLGRSYVLGRVEGMVLIAVYTAYLTAAVVLPSA